MWMHSGADVSVTGGVTMKNVLLIDPDAGFASSVTHSLGKDGYLTVWQPALTPDMLLQIELPDVVIFNVASDAQTFDNLQLCREIKKSDDSPYLIALSPNTGDASWHHLYDSGSDSVLHKTSDVSTLSAAVRNAKSQKAHQRELQQQVVLARSAAFLAMSTSSRVGEVVRFMQSTLAAQTVSEIARSLFEILGGMSLYGMLAFRVGKNRDCFSDRGEINPVEVAILDAVPVSQRILEDGLTLVVQYPLCSLLIRNLPVDDADIRGQLRDDLCVLVEAIDARCKAIVLGHEAARRQQLLQTSLRVLNRIVSETDAFNLEFTQQSGEILADMTAAMNAEFSRADLKEEDEMRLVSVFESSGGRLGGLFDAKREREAIIHEIMQKLLSTIAD
jgi:DNA-binding NarL/FixJ family response regulator